MNKDKSNKKSNSNSTSDMMKTSKWFIENGYSDPAQLIDHNGNLDLPEAFIQIFAAYNQHNIRDGKAWDTWPEWELVLTSMKNELHFADSESDTAGILAERQNWLSLVQLMHDSEAVRIDGYTISIEGLHGHQFTFDMFLEHEIWADTWNCGVKHYEYLKEYSKALGPPLKRKETRVVVEHSLEAFWKCPEHVPKYGGQSTKLTHDNRVCIEKEEGNTFPLAMYALIQLCIDDTEIWKIQFEKDLADFEHRVLFDRKWPGGRPEDWEYQ